MRLKLGERATQDLEGPLEISDWLRGLSLERYAETFRDNAIDVAVQGSEPMREPGMMLATR